ncbi:unnamed protein product [Phyllotreta striolata]|uniref:Uncharacterized protein n=1 Tax=Phyllotreta striolata TaxID=444603 RepID=A0A9N9TT57_PHYSR|nr:unnamed protein product [Phyllotreta striolata]
MKCLYKGLHLSNRQISLRHFQKLFWFPAINMSNIFCVFILLVCIFTLTLTHPTNDLTEQLSNVNANNKDHDLKANDLETEESRWGRYGGYGRGWGGWGRPGWGAWGRTRWGGVGVGLYRPYYPGFTGLGWGYRPYGVGWGHGFWG